MGYKVAWSRVNQHLLTIPIKCVLIKSILLRSIHLLQHYIQIQWIGIIPSVLTSSAVIRQCLFFYRVCNIVSKSDLFSPPNKSNIYAINSRPTPTPTKTIFSIISSSCYTYGWFSCLSAYIYLTDPLSIRPQSLQPHIKHVSMVNYFAAAAMSLWVEEAEALHFVNGIYRHDSSPYIWWTAKCKHIFFVYLEKYCDNFKHNKFNQVGRG